MFEIKLENEYNIEIHNGIACIRENKANKLSEYILLHNIVHIPKCTKKNCHYSYIIHVCMNTKRVEQS